MEPARILKEKNTKVHDHRTKIYKKKMKMEMENELRHDIVFSF